MTCSASLWSTSPRQLGHARIASRSLSIAMVQLLVDVGPRRGRLVLSGGLAADGLEDLVPHPLHLGLGGRLDVKTQQRLGVARAQVEPPAVALDGQAVGEVAPLGRVALV